MVRIAYNNVYGYCSGPVEELAEINHVLTYTVKGARFAHAFKSGKWDGKKTFFHRGFRSFPIGLYGYLVTKLKGIEFELEDRRGDFGEPQGNEIELWDEKTGERLQLRDYQEEAVRVFQQKGRGIIKLSTRAGKTVIGIACTQWIGLKTLFVVHTKDLLKQTAAEYKRKMRIEPGVIGDQQWNPQFVTVATVQTLSRMLKDPSRASEVQEFLESVQFVIFDEVHRASVSYQVVSRALKNCWFRMGLSATALVGDKENKLQSMAIVGHIIYEVKMEELVEKAQIAKPVAYFIEVDYAGFLGDDWDEIYEYGIVRNEDRNEMICEAALRLLKRGKESLILIEKKDHGFILEDMLKGHCKVKFVHGQHTAKQREEAKDDIQRGALDVLITTKIFNEGIDIPYLESVIVAAGWKSPILAYQRYGRGVTKTEKKTVTTIVDFIDKQHRLLRNHSDERLSICERDKAFEVKILESVDQL